MGRVQLRPVMFALALFLGAAQAQTPDHQQGLPDPVPPPLPPKPAPKDSSNYRPILTESDKPWELDGELLTKLYDKARIYREYTRRFTCDETARLAEYDGGGAVSSEKKRRYGYLLLKTANRDDISELRQEVAKNGTIKPGAIRDEEPFPPAYAWVFLFSEFNEPYFALRYMGERFDGFDWVHEIQFKGGLPFSDGKDIRQWEGIVLIDAVTHTPLEIVAEPSGQRDRIEGMYRNWSKSFNFLGMRSAPRPLGYQARIQFRHRSDKVDLTFPTEMRYDTFRAVGLNRVVPTLASTRSYSNYQITFVRIDQKTGDPVNP